MVIGWDIFAHSELLLLNALICNSFDNPRMIANAIFILLKETYIQKKLPRRQFWSK